MTRLVIAEDQVMMREALVTLLGQEEGLEVVGRCGRGDEVVALARDTAAEVALVDIELPGIDGLAAAAALREEVPACAVLIVTTFGRPGYLRRALEAGVRGFVVKDGPVEELADAIHRVVAGERVIDPVLAVDALASGGSPLTRREADALSAAAGGATIADIATGLHLSRQTVRNYLSSAIRKTGARNRIEAAERARSAGWL